MFAIATEDPFNTLWALWFYERVVFAAFTEGPGLTKIQHRL